MSPPKHQHICPGCFRNKGDADVCPLCGFVESAKGNPIALPYWTLLNRQYLTGRVLGKLGGFGITYLAWDTRLDIPAAIKEYLPRDFAGRDGASTIVSTHSPEDDKMFRYGLKMFLDEAKTLAKFDHPNIVRVRNVFENNGTAYLVMDYLEGESLNEYLQRKGEPMDEARALDIVLPVLDGLEEVHRTGFLHRDIKPHNLYLTQSGRTILLDFGAARQAIGENARSQSVLLTPGYAPFEQYHRRGNQGPWTDVYACAAVLYHMVCGTPPPESTERIEEDRLLDPRQLNPSLSLGFAMALMQGLAMPVKDRPQSVAVFRDLLAPPSFHAAPPPPPAPPPPKAQPARPAPTKPPLAGGREDSLPPAAWDWGKTVIALALVVALGAAYPLFKHFKARPSQTPTRAEQPAEEMEASPALAEAEPSEPVVVEAQPAQKPAQDCGYCPKLEWVAGGEFWMGADEADANAQADEKPRHKVRLEGFFIGQYEVTQGQWKQVMGSNPSLFSACGDDCPVENVSWIEIQGYLEKLNRQSGLRCRLPTEAEWEFACRDGGQAQSYCGGDNPDELAWHEGNTSAAHPVGSKHANALGLYDMSGNVWEWTSSIYLPYPYQADDGRENGADAGQPRVLRGGFWGMPKERARASSRNSSPPDLRNFDLGFRLACESTAAGR